MDTIDTDLPCVRCGYNLRTLGRDGVCPECGASVAETLAAASLRLAPFGRLRALPPETLLATRRAVTPAIVSWFAGLPLVIPLMTLSYNGSQALRGILELLPFVGCYVLSAWAAWHLATAGRDRASFFTRFMRSVILAGVVAVGLIFLNARWSAYSRLRIKRPVHAPIGVVIACGKG